MNRPSPVTPSELRKLADADLYTKELSKQATAAVPGLLEKMEAYTRECARQGFRSALLITRSKPPFDHVKCQQWSDAATALAYHREYRPVVDPAELRSMIVEHFRSLGFRVKFIADPHQVRNSHLSWLFRWLMPRDTIQVIW